MGLGSLLLLGFRSELQAENLFVEVHVLPHEHVSWETVDDVFTVFAEKHLGVGIEPLVLVVILLFFRFHFHSPLWFWDSSFRTPVHKWLTG